MPAASTANMHPIGARVRVRQKSRTAVTAGISAPGLPAPIMSTTTRLAHGTPVVVTVRGKTTGAAITGYVETAKGLFYQTKDEAGVIRKARPAQVSPGGSIQLTAGPPTAGKPPATASPVPRKVSVRTQRKGSATATRTLPGWPRGMPIDLAAAYVGLSETMLREQDIPRTWLSPGRMVFLREHLDQFLDRKAGIAPAAAEEVTDLDELFANSPRRLSQLGKRP